MKNLLILLLFVTLNAKSQKLKTPKYNVINPEKRLATLCKDTLFVHIAFDKPTEYAKLKLSYLKHKGMVYRYKIAFFDPSLFWAEQSTSKKQIKIY